MSSTILVSKDQSLAEVVNKVTEQRYIQLVKVPVHVR